MIKNLNIKSLKMRQNWNIEFPITLNDAEKYLS